MTPAWRRWASVANWPEPARLWLAAGPLAVVGALHLPPATAAAVDRLIPAALPGPARAWTVGSGVVEVATAAGLLAPSTRTRTAPWATVLLAALWVGNVTMAVDWRRRGASAPARAIAYGRLPLQVPLMQAAWSLRRR